jgi:signal transduction histidine kinase
MSSAAPLKDSGGQLLGSVEIIRDISRQVALEQEKEDFVSMLSHDLKSPITAIVGSIDLVRDARLGPVLPEQREYLDSAVESCDEMVEMIDTLLDVHKFEAGRMTMLIKPEDIRILLQKVLSRYKPAAGRLQLTLELELQDGLPLVMLDRAKISRVLGNLLSNAMKFTSEKGAIRIRAEMARDVGGLRQRIPVSLYPNDTIPGDSDFLLLSVADTGVGIPSDALAFIFDRFTQVQNRRMGKTRGTGLGLAFCRKAVDLHHGYIWAESCEGKGSTFFLLIPVSGGQ